jgi:stearoyl-CoA desaturase (Delta-9 desaturase)
MPETLLARPAVVVAAPDPVPNWVRSLPLIFIHLTPLAVIFTGVDWVSLCLFLGCYSLHIFGITGGYHRYFSHRSYKTSRAFQFVLAVVGCTAFERGPLWWAAHHRHHHRHSDQPEDAHSPLQGGKWGGLWWSHLGWLLHPTCTETRPVTLHDISKYPEIRWIDRFYWLPPLALAVMCYFVNGWSGVVWGAGIATLLSLHAIFLVNSACHLWGKRRFQTKDASRNNPIVAVLTFGEGWHNNHHHYQSSARQGFYWWEVDVSYYIIRSLAFVGIVWDIRQPPAHKLAVTSGQGDVSRPRRKMDPLVTVNPEISEESARRTGIPYDSLA